MSSISGTRGGAIQTELDLRLEIWTRLVNLGPDSIAPSVIRDLGIYAGQAGVYADKSRTRHLTPDGGGIAVSVLHTGTSYADDLSEDGLLYHYPKTNRSPAHDEGEIQALKWAKEFALPIFTITPSPTSGSLRAVHLSWVEDHDDLRGLVLLSFGTEPTSVETELTEEAPFFLTASREELRALRKVRVGQQKFKFEVMRRYGGACTACGIDLSQLVDAAHIYANGEGGSNDARNGLPLCALHHRAYDNSYWSINPDNGDIVARAAGPTLEELRITNPSITHLPLLPHASALEHAWERFDKYR